MRKPAELDDVALGRVATVVRQRMSEKFSMKDMKRFFTHDRQMVYELLQATYIAVREELERVDGD